VLAVPDDVISELVLRPLADAFLGVGVFVAVLLAAVGWLRWRYGDGLPALLERHRRWAPALGALLGVSPGCAGAILVMPLYARGSVSFGTVIAALAATMGDSSWVILAADPEAALQVHAILFVTGLVTGYAVDALGIAPPTRARLRSGGSEPLAAESLPGQPLAARRLAAESLPGRPLAGAGGWSGGRGGPAPVGAPVGVAVTSRQAPGVPGGAGVVGLGRLEPAAMAFWALAAVGFVVAVPVLFQAVDAGTLTAALGGVDPYLTVGALGTVAALLVFASGRGRLSDDTLDSATATSATSPFAEVLRHGARETSFVVVWVAAAYLAWTLIETATGFDGTALPLLGLAGVVVGATIGLIPGCAVQIVFTGLFVAGAVPLPTLVANAISQDGDALLPLLALERRSAVLATVITTVPGLLVGGLLLALS